jgi:hypothetical protein
MGSTFDMDDLPRDDFTLLCHHRHKSTYRQVTSHSSEMMLRCLGIRKHRLFVSAASAERDNDEDLCATRPWQGA